MTNLLAKLLGRSEPAGPEVPAMPEAPEAVLRRVMASLPREVWTSSCPPTYFRIRANRAEPVPADYAGQPGELVFCYTNDEGCISIQKTYPPEEAAAA